MNRIKTLSVLLLWLAAAGTMGWAGDSFINVDEERSFVDSWEPPQIVTMGGHTVIIPSTPNFVRRTIGFSLVIHRCDVSSFVAEVELAAVDKDSKIANRKGEIVAVGTNKYKVLNNQLFRVLGQADGLVYFKHLKTRTLVSLPLVNETTADTKG